MDKSSSSQPSSNGARARYLGGLPPEKQVEVLLKAERLGPAPNDEADWLVAQAASDAAQRIDEAAKRIEAAIGTEKPDAAERLERIEALVRRNGKPAEGGAGNPLMRDLLVALVSVLSMTALAVAVAGFAPPMALTAAFGLGIAVTLLYLWAAPIVMAMRRR